MKKYGKDYRKAKDGYEYTGNWYKTALTGDALKREARFFWICLAVMSVKFVLGLLLNNAGSRIFWILLPFVALYLPLLYGWLGSAKLYRIGKRLEEQVTQREEASQRCFAQAEEVPKAGTDSAGEPPQTGSPRHSPKGPKELTTAKDPQVQIPAEHWGHLRRSEYEQSFRRLLRSFVAGAVLANAVFLADLLVLAGGSMSGSSGSVMSEAVFAGNAAVLAALNLSCAGKSWKVHASVCEEREMPASEGQNKGTPKGGQKC